MTKDYSKTDNWNRNVRTIAEHSKKFPMTRKVDTYEYESLEKMILDDQIRYSEVIELFTDKIYRAWFYERNFADEQVTVTRYSDL